jgi:hypothetical protein
LIATALLPPDGAAMSRKGMMDLEIQDFLPYKPIQKS